MRGGEVQILSKNRKIKKILEKIKIKIENNIKNSENFENMLHKTAAIFNTNTIDTIKNIIDPNNENKTEENKGKKDKKEENKDKEKTKEEDNEEKIE